MEIGKVNDAPPSDPTGSKRYVVSITAKSHEWLSTEAHRRNVSLQKVTEEAFFAYRHLVPDSVGIEGEE